MSEKNLQGQMEDELDLVLKWANEAEDEKREAERIVQTKRERSTELETKAQQLRMALYALAGHYTKSRGDANADNHARRQELKREASRG